MLTGPTHIPANVTHALVCLHGFGADGHDFIGLAHPLQASLPAHIRLAVLCPNAPAPTPFGQGYQWFSDKSWTFRDREGIQQASEAVWAYLHHHLRQHLNLPAANIAVLSFSQGAMTITFAAPRWPEKIGGVIAHSGLAMWQEELNPATCQKPSFLFLHGQDDDVVPADQTLHAAGGLAQLGFQVESHILPGLAHGVDARSLAHISVFLQTIWNTEQT